MQKKIKKPVIGKWFHPDKIKLETYSNINKPPIITELPITVDNRFVIGNLYQYLTNEQKELEVIIDEEVDFIKIDEKYYYVPEGRTERLTQAQIDSYLMKKILYTNIQSLTELLDYQLSKYPNTLKRLKDLKALFCNRNYFLIPQRDGKYDYREGHQDRCREWAKDCISKFQLINEQENKAEFIDTLEKTCNGSKEYDTIKAWFIQEGLIDPDTLFWKDTQKGKKSILVNYIKDLHQKGYSKELKHAEIVAIAIKSFGVNISIDTVKTANLKGMPEIPSFKS